MKKKKKKKSSENDQSTGHFQSLFFFLFRPPDPKSEKKNPVNQPIKKSGLNFLTLRFLSLKQEKRGFEPHRRHCVVVLEQDTFILA